LVIGVEHLVTVAPSRAYASVFAVEECGDGMLHYTAIRKALRAARILADDIAELHPPPAINSLMLRVVEQLRELAANTHHHVQALQAAPPVPPTVPAKPQPVPSGLEWIDLALALLIRHKGNITAKEVAARVGVSEPTLCKNEEWQKARETFRQSRKKSEEISEPANVEESDDEE
jgi:hypothetical protein